MYCPDLKSPGNKRKLTDFELILEPGDILRVTCSHGRLVVLMETAISLQVGSAPMSYELHATAESFFLDGMQRQAAGEIAWSKEKYGKPK